MLRCLSACCVSLLVGCSTDPPAPKAAAALPPPLPAAKLPPGTWIEDRTEPKLPEEKAALDWIVETRKSLGHRWKTIRAVRWGPHDMTCRWARQLWSDPIQPGDSAIRLAYTIADIDGRVERESSVVIVRKGKGVGFVRQASLRGDLWFGKIPEDD